MKKKIILFLGSATLFVACDKLSKEEDVKKTDQSVLTIENSKVDGLYLYEKNGDTVSLQLTVVENKASGNLIYSFKEKDKNTGTFVGEFKEDLLLVDYTFLSEGVSSVRQVAFKIGKSTATEGYADMEEINGKLVFKDVKKLQFNEKMILKKSNKNI